VEATYPIKCVCGRSVAFYDLQKEVKNLKEQLLKQGRQLDEKLDKVLEIISGSKEQVNGTFNSLKDKNYACCINAATA
jgi:hypothetical protein